MTTSLAGEFETFDINVWCTRWPPAL